MRLEHFITSRRPSYAILSHTWEEEEVSYQDFMQGRGPQMNSYRKIVSCCQKAKEEGYQWVWIDTCCIDKTSSAELTEAINSIFWWYMEAEVSVEKEDSIAE
jgi:hypothetical protein